MRVAFKVFEGSTPDWDTLLTEAAAFATGLGRDRVINVSVSHGGGSSVFGAGGAVTVVVWYWEPEDRA